VHASLQQPRRGPAGHQRARGRPCSARLWPSASAPRRAAPIWRGAARGVKVRASKGAAISATAATPQHAAKRGRRALLREKCARGPCGTALARACRALNVGWVGALSTAMACGNAGWGRGPVLRARMRVCLTHGEPERARCLRPRHVRGLRGRLWRRAPPRRAVCACAEKSIMAGFRTGAVAPPNPLPRAAPRGRIACRAGLKSAPA
jgi:hypothetical protein